MRWCTAVGVEPMLAVNLGTRGVQEAVDLLEYANHPSGTALSNARITNGSPAPHDIRMWCLSNEMDGHWQLGHKTAPEYGRLAAETARAMRQLDPGLELVAVGSSGPWMPTYVDWERVVLATANLVDAISLHNYYQEDPNDLATFLASAVDLDRFIERVAEVVDDAHYIGPDAAREAVGRRVERHPLERRAHADRMVRRRANGRGGLHGRQRGRRREPADLADPARQPGRERVSRPAGQRDRAPFGPPGDPWRRTIPFSLAARNARGQALAVPITVAPTIATKHGDVAPIDAVATIDDATGTLALFVVSRHPTEAIDLTIDLRSWPEALRLRESLVVHDGDLQAANTEAIPAGSSHAHSPTSRSTAAASG